MQFINKIKRFNCKICFYHDSISAFKSGGKIQYLVYPYDGLSLTQITQVFEDNQVDYKVVGNCTNILFKDGLCKKVIVCTKYILGITILEDGLYSYCGESLYNLYLKAKNNYLSGIEALNGIPGTLGGAICQNAGAYGVEIKDIIEYVDYFEDGKLNRKNVEEVNFSYRDSEFKNTTRIIIGAKLKLKKAELIKIDSVAKLCAQKRLRTQPKGISLGCVFKKVGDISAGYYIEKAGFKGCRVGDAEVSKKHANFIINRGNASSSDYINLAELIRAKVDNMYNIGLQYEIEII